MNHLKDAFDLYIEESLSQIPNEMEASKKFHRNMKKIIRHAEFNRRKSHKLRYALIAALIAILVMATTVLAIPQLRNGLFHLDVFTKYSTVRVEAFQGGSSEEKTYTITKTPKRLKLVDSMKTTDYGMAVLESGDGGEWVHIEQFPAENYQSSIDTENTEAEMVEVNETQAVYSEKDGIGILVWNQEQYVFQMSGNLTKADMISIAGSIALN